VDEVPILGVQETKDAFKTFQAMYGAPAYVRRAREVEAALERLLQRCRTQRDEWLPMVRLRLGILKALAGAWPALAPLLADEKQLGQLEQMERDLAPSLRAPVAPTASRRRLRRALLELRASVEHFNRRWQAYLSAVDLDAVNGLRDGYNRYYVLEKECAVRSPRLAREGFVRLEPLTTAHLFAALPPLPVPLPAG
jgi:hypothetical protein